MSDGLKKTNRRWTCLTLCIAVVLAIPLLIWLSLGVIRIIAAATNYDDIREEEDGFTYLIRDTGKKAAVSGYTYDPASGNNEIDIPEVYGEYPVKALGGSYGLGGSCSFHVMIKGVQSSASIGRSEGSFEWYTKEKNIRIVYHDLVLNIGPDIRKISAYSDGLLEGKKLHVVRLYVNCDPENRKFYSKDGILYRKNGEVYSGFIYWNQEF